VKDPRELSTACGFWLARSVCEEYVRSLDTKFIISVENLKNTLSFRDQAVSMDEDTINIERKCHVFCSCSLH
jgi:hypothetical protein